MLESEQQASIVQEENDLASADLNQEEPLPDSVSLDDPQVEQEEPLPKTVSRDDEPQLFQKEPEQFEVDVDYKHQPSNLLSQGVGL